MKKYLFYFCVIVSGVGLYPLFSAEAVQEFYVNSEYEPAGNTLEKAVNLTSSTRAQFFVEEDYYDKLSEKDKDIFLTKTAELGVVFDSEIYFKIKSLFGEEWTPGIDNDSRITVYITDMKSEINGYFREIDEYDYFRYPDSNQREMVYINAKYVVGATASAILAHEFQHLINFNQKKRLRGLDEEKWLNEAMSEYAVTFSGQDKKSDYLKNAVKNFLAVPTDALGIWEETSNDRASVSLFIHYLAERYGEGVIKDISQSDFTGEEAINYALQKNGFDKNFSDVFQDWTVALFLNSSLLSLPPPVLSLPPPGNGDIAVTWWRQVYQFAHSDLQYSALHVSPQLTYSVSETGINAGFVVRDLAPEWHRFLPAKYDQENPRALRVEFNSRNDYYFRVPVVVTYLSGKIDVTETEIKNGKGFVEIPEFNAQVSSVVIIPASHTKLADFSQQDPLRTFSYSVSLLPIPGNAVTRYRQHGDIIRAENRLEVYVIKDGFRRHIQHPIIFYFYAHLKWENVKSISSDEQDKYKESKLIRQAGDYKVYEIIGFRQFRWLDMTAKDFEWLGYDWNAVYEVNNIEWGWYKEI